MPAEKLDLDEAAFRWMHNEDAMPTDKLAEGIRRFHADAQKLERLIVSLAAAGGEVERRLSPEEARRAPLERVSLDEPAYRWLHNEDAMAVDKLAEGIRRFDADARKLEQFVLSLVKERRAAA